MSARGGPWVLVIPVVAVLAAWFWTRPAEEAEPAQAAPVPVDAKEQVEIWTGSLSSLGGEPIGLRLLPLHGESGWGDFDRAVIRKRFGLPEGQAWRLEVEAGAELSGQALAGARVIDAQGVALLTFDEAREAGANEDGPLGKLLAGGGAGGGAEPRDPLLGLFSARAARPGEAPGAILWGRAPGETAELSLEFKLEGKMEPVSASTTLLREQAACGDLPRHIWQLSPGELEALRTPRDG